MKKYKCIIILALIVVLSSKILCYADENTIDESRLKGCCLPIGDENKFINGYGIIQSSEGYSRSMLYGLIDKDYNVVVEPAYYWITYDSYDENIIYAFMDTYARYGDIYKITDQGLKKINSEMYCMNLSFAVRLESAFGGFENINSSAFSGDMIAVADRQHEHYGVIDKSGNFIMPFTDKYVYLVQDPYIIRYINTGTYETGSKIVADGQLLNSSVEVLTEAKYDYIEILADYIRVTKDGRVNILDTNDYSELSNWSYTVLEPVGNYFIAKDLNGMYGIIDKSGNTAVDFLYKKIRWDKSTGFHSYDEDDGTYAKIKLPGEADISEETEEAPDTGSQPEAPIETQAYFPVYDVTLNGIKMENHERLYPVIGYANIAYFPMTYYDSRLLGLETKWDSVSGLKITGFGSHMGYDEYKTELAEEPNPHSIKVFTVDYDVYVNGKSIDELAGHYPLLTYKDITYLPMVYKLFANELGWEYCYSKDEGLIINSRN